MARDKKQENEHTFSETITVGAKTLKILYANNPLIPSRIVVQVQEQDRPAAPSKPINIHTNGLSAQLISERGGIVAYADIQARVMILIMKYIPFTCANILLDALEV